ncbi:SatD family protein [Marinifilum sp. RC60d5]|uniref:SatD family protein n=1 Tax=Marinifilum sp. RC60d5 TaxID=3458414 RepID=UPI004036E577
MNKKLMKAVLTGDIINSRKGDVTEWLNSLKTVLQKYGNEPKQWEIYRGDSFQLVISPEDILIAAFHIKASLKQTKNYDVRIGIGLGEESHSAYKVSESNGGAYVNSGECFENLKKRTIAIKSDHKDFDNTINLILSLILLTANSWSNTVAKTIKTSLENPDKHQKEIAKLLGKSQSSISEALKRGGYEEILKINNFYRAQLSKL